MSRSRRPSDQSPAIRVRGARQNNLKGIDVDIPLNQMTVITGPSGSGKSSFAFQTLYAEGQRRYVETFSPYTRQFFDRMDKPLVDEIDGIPPAIALEQANHVKTTRSTVGTITEINDYLKLYFPRLAQAHCPKCGELIECDTAASVAAKLKSNFGGKQVLLTFAIPVPADTAPADFFSFLQQQGYLRLWLHGALFRIDEASDGPTPKLPAKVDVIQDRFKLSADQNGRLMEGLEAALRFGKGQIKIVDVKSGNESSFSSGWHCAACDLDITPPSPALFNFNHPLGACPDCRGFGRVIGIDRDKVIPDPDRSIYRGLIVPFHGGTYYECQEALERFANKRGIKLSAPFSSLSEADQRWIYEGEKEGKADPEGNWDGGWYGVQGFFDWLERRTYKMHVRVFLSRFRSYTTCRTCNGGRLQPAALNYRVSGRTLPDWWQLPIDELLPVLDDESEKLKDSGTQLLHEQVTNRLRYLLHVGLGYLTLDRTSRTLSGGELQRVNLTTCLGASLVNTLFVLDEPSIGLHPRDISRLVDVMHDLRDKGNTLAVVEHEEAIIRAADHLVDIGPGRGDQGGHLLYAGPLMGGEDVKSSLTFDYLNHVKSIPVPKTRRKGKMLHSLKIKGARQHNLKDLSVAVPLGVFCCITGVSGSGKSTLVHSVLYRHLMKQRGESLEEEPGKVKSVTGGNLVNEVVMVDQSPLARTPRSTPALYVGAFEHIRKLFTATDEAMSRGLLPGYFSFNSGTGRCERCMGSGYEKVEMQFLSDLYVMCPECEGRRFQPEALEIRLNELSIHDVLQLTVDQAEVFFEAMEGKAASGIIRSLKVIQSVGLGYLKLGQPLNTLSGGEAQRLKLVGHLVAQNLSRKKNKNALLIFDEPTTGLHFDDVAILLRVFHRLVDQGNSVLVIEHNLDVIKNADHVIDLGPEAGVNGGYLVGSGTPEQLAEVEESHTGRYLRSLLGLDEFTLRVAEESPARPRVVMPKAGVIEIFGARENNLKNLHLELPRDKMVVVTGLSGSGKSTLAFDILFSEGQRRFLDSMSPYARQFTQQMEKAEVDLITGLPPTVAIEQRISRGGGKSTVATVTEIYHFLRLLFSKVGRQFCPTCHEPVEKQSVSGIVTQLRNAVKKGSITLMVPLIKGRKGFHTDVARWASNHGYDMLWVDGEFKGTEKFQRLERFKEHDIDVVVANYKKGERPSPDVFRAKVEEALRIGKGTARYLDHQSKIHILSSEMTCPSCERAFEELDPRLFSYNSPHGWCPECRGYGEIEKGDVFSADKHESHLEAELQEEHRRGRVDASEMEMCTSCEGARLNEVARNVFIKNISIQELAALPVSEVEGMMNRFSFAGRDQIVARDILSEIRQRLIFLDEVGLGYLSLNRSAKTLSGGEAQRIRLAAQLGSNLRGVLYVLDEPTIGLHPRDNVKLLNTLDALRQQGNSLVIVEHDEETMQRADHILDLGPGAGMFGGEVVASGTLKQIQRLKTSVTGQWLKNPIQHPVRGSYRELPRKKSDWLKIKGISFHNIENIDVSLPLGTLIGIAGISGSGKSSLMRGVIKPAVESVISGKTPNSGKTWKSISGANAIAAVYEVDQSPIGKTSRSTPGTYVKVFDEIRKLFSGVPTSRMRGYTASRFSFNTEGGRCETCGGHGKIKMEMNFLPPSYVNCEACGGSRYNSATLEAEYHGKNIADVMRMTIDEAKDFFESNPKIHRSLRLLSETGTGYLQLGQASPTLSGGEAQRIKLVTQLTKGVSRSDKARLSGMNAGGKTNLYLIEEPSIGLHMADVSKLIEVLHHLVDDGHTVIVIEHNLDILAEVDYLIDMGPEAGPEGGEIVAEGPPSLVVKSKVSRTAPFLANLLNLRTPK